MHHLSRSVLIGLIAFAAVYCGEAFSSEPFTPEERLVSILGGVETLHAEFVHEASVSGRQAGEIWLSKPGLFRVETGTPLSQTIVSDGVSMWTHDRDLEQVIISPLDTRIDEMPILLFSGEPDLIPLNYRIEFYDDEQRQHFRLTPFDSTNLITTLVLTFEDNLPMSITVENAMGERTIIKLSNVGELVDVTEQTFTFHVPEFADVIDDRPG